MTRPEHALPIGGSVGVARLKHDLNTLGECACTSSRPAAQLQVSSRCTGPFSRAAAAQLRSRAVGPPGAGGLSWNLDTDTSVAHVICTVGGSGPSCRNDPLWISHAKFIMKLQNGDMEEDKKGERKA